DLIGRHLQDGNGRGVDGAGELAAEELDGGGDDEPGDDAAGEHGAGDLGPDDVADAEVLGGDVGAQACAGKEFGVPGGGAFPEAERIHEELVDAADGEAPKDAAGEVAALLAGLQHVGAGRAFGVGQHAVLLDDE